MMSLLWYYRPEHLQGGRSPSMHEVSCLVAGRQGHGEHGMGQQPGWSGTWTCHLGHREPGEGPEL